MKIRIAPAKMLVICAGLHLSAISLHAQYLHFDDSRTGGRQQLKWRKEQFCAYGLIDTSGVLIRDLMDAVYGPVMNGLVVVDIGMKGYLMDTAGVLRDMKLGGGYLDKPRLTGFCEGIAMCDKGYINRLGEIFAGYQGQKTPFRDGYAAATKTEKSIKWDIIDTLGEVLYSVNLKDHPSFKIENLGRGMFAVKNTIIGYSSNDYWLQIANRKAQRLDQYDSPVKPDEADPQVDYTQPAVVPTVLYDRAGNALTAMLKKPDANNWYISEIGQFQNGYAIVYFRYDGDPAEQERRRAEQEQKSVAATQKADAQTRDELMNGGAKCKTCNGTGKVDNTRKTEYVNSYGRTVKTVDDKFRTTGPCAACNGTGRIKK